MKRMNVNYIDDPNKGVQESPVLKAQKENRVREKFLKRKNSSLLIDPARHEIEVLINSSMKKLKDIQEDLFD